MDEIMKNPEYKGWIYFCKELWLSDNKNISTLTKRNDISCNCRVINFVCDNISDFD